MRAFRARSGAALLALLAPTPALAAEAEAEADAAADEANVILVTARNRTEKAGEVPIAISVRFGDRIARERVFAIADLTQRVRGLIGAQQRLQQPGSPVTIMAITA